MLAQNSLSISASDFIGLRTPAVESGLSSERTPSAAQVAVSPALNSASSERIPNLDPSRVGDPGLGGES
jgi:hypothetical protein